MKKVFNSVAHFLAWLGGTALPAAEKDIKTVESDVESPIADAIASLEGDKAKNVQAAIAALGGQALAVLIDTGEAVADKGLNLTVDKAAVASVEQAIADIKAVFGGKSIPVSTPTAVVAGNAA